VWLNFTKVIEKARESCQTSYNTVSDHVVGVNNMVLLESCTKKKRDTIIPPDLLRKTGRPE
jgi:DNA-damage-inducible protein D